MDSVASTLARIIADIQLHRRSHLIVKNPIGVIADSHRLNDSLLERLLLAVPPPERVWKFTKRLPRNDSLAMAYGVQQQGCTSEDGCGDPQPDRRGSTKHCCAPASSLISSESNGRQT